MNGNEYGRSVEQLQCIVGCRSLRREVKCLHVRRGEPFRELPQNGLADSDQLDRWRIGEELYKCHDRTAALEGRFRSPCTGNAVESQRTEIGETRRIQA